MIYEPQEDSFLLTEQVKLYSKNKKVLDMGSGSGIQAITAKQSGAKEVIACDINKESLDLVRKKGIEAIQSNLFSKIKGEFEVIVFNPPYLPLDKREDAESRTITTAGKKGDEIILRFIRQAKSHLAKDGTILMVISSITPQKRINNIIKRLNLTKKVVSEMNLFMEKLEVWEIKNGKI